MLLLWENIWQGACVVQITDTEEVETLVGLFENVARVEGWQPEDALRHNRENSVYFGLYVQGQLAGGLQLVRSVLRDDSRGVLPCQVVWPEIPVPLPLSRRAHVSVLALDASVRGQGNLFWMLVVEMWRYCVGEGIATLFIEVTPRVLPLYQRLGWPLKIQGERKVHWGEECYLCTLGIPEVAQTLLLKAENSRYYQHIIAQAFRVTLADSNPMKKPEVSSVNLVSVSV